MNLRISQNELRFRVSKDELEGLLSGQALELNVPPMLKATIKLSAHAGASLSVIREDDLLVLTVSEEAARALLASLPNREGLEAQQSMDGQPPLNLLLEVDIRTQKRKRD